MQESGAQQLNNKRSRIKFRVAAPAPYTMTRVYIPYSQKDEAFKADLEKHLSGLRRNGYIETWTTQKIDVQPVNNTAVSEAFLQAGVILLLISPSFTGSEYLQSNELKLALARHQKGEAILIPILLRKTGLQQTTISSFETLPGGASIEEYENADEAYSNLIGSIKAAIRKLNGEVINGEVEIGLSHSQELLSSLKRRAMQAIQAQDFRILLFDVRQFRLEYPEIDGIDEIERIVRNGLGFETQTTSSFGRRKAGKTATIRQRSRQIAVIGLLLVATLSVVAWSYLH